MWRRFASSVILRDKIFEYFKHVELAIVVIIRSLEDECTFSTVTFMKKNQLTTNMDLVVRMYALDFFTLQTFPFQIEIKDWNEEKTHYGLKL
jgi:hypothetical protein